MILPNIPVFGKYATTVRRISVFLLLLSSSTLFAQDTTHVRGAFEGLWEGTLTQETGGVRPVYYFAIYVKQHGNRISGYTISRFDDKEARMELRGTITKNKLKFHESRFLSQDDLGDLLHWCLKRGVLKRVRSGDTEQLEGYWEGNANELEPCVPGTIKLVRKLNRA